MGGHVVSKGACVAHDGLNEVRLSFDQTAWTTRTDSSFPKKKLFKIKKYMILDTKWLYYYLKILSHPAFRAKI